MKQYYIDGITETKLAKIAKAFDEKIDNGNDEIILKNGTAILAYRDEKKYQIFDEELNLIGEYNNNTIGKYNLAKDILRWSRMN